MNSFWKPLILISDFEISRLNIKLKIKGDNQKPLIISLFLYVIILSKIVQLIFNAKDIELDGFSGKNTINPSWDLLKLRVPPPNNSTVFILFS